MDSVCRLPQAQRSFRQHYLWASPSATRVLFRASEPRGAPLAMACACRKKRRTNSSMVRIGKAN